MNKRKIIYSLEIFSDAKTEHVYESVFNRNYENSDEHLAIIQILKKELDEVLDHGLSRTMTNEVTD